MENEQLTAVEWLSEYVLNNLSTSEETILAINAAKQMEKEQRDEAFSEGYSCGSNNTAY